MEKICLTEEEILETPNNLELGEKVRRKLWEEKETNNANTNSPVSMGRLPGWLLCGKSPPCYLPPAPQGSLSGEQCVIKHKSKNESS